MDDDFQDELQVGKESQKKKLKQFLPTFWKLKHILNELKKPTTDRQKLRNGDGIAMMKWHQPSVLRYQPNSLLQA